MHTLHHGNCLNILPTLAAQSVDAIIADPPYGTTACKWDSVIPLDAMWLELKRVIKPRGAVVLFASQPFTSVLINSNLDWFKYELIWDKGRGHEPQLANIRPMKAHENLVVFGNGRITYNPQMTERDEPIFRGKLQGNRPNSRKDGNGQNILVSPSVDRVYTHRFPISIVTALNSDNTNKVHPTQKPVELLRYLIRTYTNAGETVLDFCYGSGTTGVAALMEGRHFIGIEKDADYYALGARRIEQVQPALMEAAD